MHSMCSWAIQSHLHRGVRAVSARLGDGRAERSTRHKMHGVCSWAIQPQLHHSMRVVSCRISDRHAGISGCDCMYNMWRGSLQRPTYRCVRKLHGRAVPRQRGAVELLDMSRWLVHRHSSWDRRSPLHGVCGGPVQRRSHLGMCTMRSGLRDRCVEGLWCRKLHGMCGGTVQLCVDIGMHDLCARVGDQHVGGRRRDRVQCVCGGAVQRGVDPGVCGLCGGAVSGPGRPVAMLGVCGWGGDEHVVGRGCCELHGVCGG